MDTNLQGVKAPSLIDVKPVLVNQAARGQVGASPQAPVSTDSANAAAVSAEPLPNELGQAVSYLQEFAQSIQRDLAFSLDDASGRVVIEVRDQASGDVIRQIPSEEALQLMKHLEEARSLLFHETA